MTYDTSFRFPTNNAPTLSDIGEIKSGNESTQAVKLSPQCPVAYKQPEVGKAHIPFTSKINQLKGIVRLRQSFNNLFKVLKDFFHKTPATQTFCNSLNIPREQFTQLSPQLQVFIVRSELMDGEENLPVEVKLANAKNFEGELKNFLSTQQDPSPELTKFHEKLQSSIQTMEQERISLFKQVVVDGKVIQEKADVMSYNFGGQKIANKPIEVSINGEKKEVKLAYTPQKLLSGYPGDPYMKHCSSETHGKSDHIPNLWKQEVEIGGNKVNFLRHGCIYGKESAAKELLANSLTLTYDDMNSLPQSSPNNPISIKLSNVQLLTQGKAHGPNISDADLPKKQMEALNKLSQENSIELDYQGKKIFVKLEPPLLFNFGTNMQQFKKIFQPLVNHRDSDAANLSSFKRLFGDDFPQMQTTTNGKTIWGGEVAKALTSDQVSVETKQQIQKLAQNIVSLYKNHPHGVASNPYALPSNTILLTNLLGYPTSYNCKSGKDRTGACSIEVTQLAAQVFGGGEIADPQKPISREEQKNLQAIYNSGEANQICKVNTLQENLKLPSSVAGITCKGLNDRFGFALEKDFAENHYQYLNG